MKYSQIAQDSYFIPVMFQSIFRYRKVIDTMRTSTCEKVVNYRLTEGCVALQS